MDETTINLQLAASDPHSSVYISASAGSGKTKVLIDRVLRLLLSGASMSSILCITYTTAAALEIRQRIESKLRHWLICDELALRSELQQLCGKTAENQASVMARSLYFNFLNPQQTVKIKTLHAFCLELLQKAAQNTTSTQNSPSLAKPELIITNREMKIIDDHAKKQLVEAILHELIFYFSQENLNNIISYEKRQNNQDAKLNGDLELAQISIIQNKIQLLLNKYDINSLLTIIYEIISIEPSIFRDIIPSDANQKALPSSPPHSESPQQQYIATMSALMQPETLAVIRRLVCANHLISQLLPETELLQLELQEAGLIDAQLIYNLEAARSNLRQEHNVNQEKNEAIAILDALIGYIKAFEQGQLEQFSRFCQIFLTSEFAPRARLPIKANVFKKNPELEALLREMQSKTYAIVQKTEQTALAEFNEAVATISLLTYSHYITQKDQLSWLDYNDIIRKTLVSLADLEGFSLVLYRIDLNLQHILIDEAQDLSSGQWEVIKGLTADFFSGLSSNNEINKTIFIVGDFKQSIFSFQGANPQLFQEARRFFATKHKDAHKKWQEIELNVSFRSAKQILATVDAMSNLPLFQQAFIQHDALNPAVIAHRSWHHDRNGQVLLWELEDNNADSIEQTSQDNHNKLSFYKEFIQILQDECGKDELSSNWLYKLHNDLKLSYGINKNKAEKRELIASAIAKQIATWFATQRIITGTTRIVRPQDIMVLSRKRSDIQRFLLDKLREIGIPALSDYNVANHILIRDLLAVAQFVIYPHDDFNLACLLRSDFIGLLPAELLLLNSENKNKSLFDRINNDVADNWRNLEKLIKLQNLLRELRHGYQQHSEASDFFNWFFSCWLPANGCNLAKRIVTIDQYNGEVIGFFLKKLYYFRNNYIYNSSLCNFVYFMYMETNKTHKNSVDTSNDAIQLCTAHASKGREADIVILADAYYSEDARHDLVIPTRDWFYLQTNSAAHPLPQAQKLYQSQQRYAENLRLLYVASTRARYELYAVGFSGENMKNTSKALQKSEIIGEQPNWYAILSQVELKKQLI